jgi:hypothetical protein
MILNELYHEDKLLKIDHCFEQLIRDNGDRDALNEISNLIHEIFNMGATVELVGNGNLFFGMQVHPSAEELMGITLAVIKGEDGERFKRCTGVAIVLDSQLFENDFTAREMTAMLLHEIGHKLHYKENVKIAIVELLGNLGAIGVGMALLAATPGVAGIMVGAVGLFMTTSIVSAITGTATEHEADETPIKYGYGVELHSALTKVAAMPGKAGDDPEKLRKVDWSLQMVPLFHTRRAFVLASLVRERAMAKTDFDRNLLDKQIDIVKRSYVNL